MQAMSEEDFDNYVKHRKSLESKSNSRKSKAKCEGKARSSSVESNAGPSGTLIFVSDSRLDESKIQSMITAQLESFSAVMANILQNKFLEILMLRLKS